MLLRSPETFGLKKEKGKETQKRDIWNGGSDDDDDEDDDDDSDDGDDDNNDDDSDDDDSDVAKDAEKEISNGIQNNLLCYNSIFKHMRDDNR